jgi:hypothetical protein
MAGRSSTTTSETSPEILMLGYMCIKGVEGLPEKVGILDRFGLADVDIAKICNAAPGSIRNARVQTKKVSQTK